METNSNEVELLDESPNYLSIVEMVTTLSTNERLPGFPFSEPWPKRYTGNWYEIITVNGETFIAKVDDAREWMSEGLEWKKKSGGNLSQSVIAAWKKLE